MGGYGYGNRMGGGVGVDVNGDGIVDYNIRPGVGVDVNGDGIVDYRTGPTVTPGPGAFMPGAGYGYGYGRPHGY